MARWRSWWVWLYGRSFGNFPPIFRRFIVSTVCRLLHKTNFDGLLYQLETAFLKNLLLLDVHSASD